MFSKCVLELCGVLTGIENKLVVTSGERERGGQDKAGD